MTRRSAWRRVVRALDAWDAEVFRRIAARPSPAEPAGRRPPGGRPGRRRDPDGVCMTRRSAGGGVVRALVAGDAELFRQIAARRSPALDVVLPALTRAADHSLLWAVIGAGM